MKGKKGWRLPGLGIAVFFLGVFCWQNGASQAWGAETEEDLEQASSEEWMESMDVSEINKMLQELFPEEKLDFMDVVHGVSQGEMQLNAELVNRLVKDQLFYAFRVNKKGIVSLLVIAVAAALFLNFSSVFQARQVSEISFFLLYMLLITVCLTSFLAASDWVGDGIRSLTAFMKVLCPVFFAAVTVAKGSLSAGAFYHLALLLILTADLLIVKILIPLIHVYVMTRILNSMQKEDYLSKLSELLETIVEWVLKAMLGCVIGLNVIQGLITPAIDSVKRSVLTRGVEAIPGIGDALGGTAEVVLGTAVLIKNSIGAAAAAVICLLCLAPLVQIGLIALAYKVTAAAIQPVSDHRIVECVSGVGEGCRLLLRVVFTCGVLFLLTIAIVAYTTNTV